jgi:hypothetical protein
MREASVLQLGPVLSARSNVSAVARLNLGGERPQSDGISDLSQKIYKKSADSVLPADPLFRALLM